MKFTTLKYKPIKTNKFKVLKQTKFNCSNIQNVPASSNKTSSKSSNIQNVPTVSSRKCRKDQFRSKSKYKLKT